VNLTIIHITGFKHLLSNTIRSLFLKEFKTYSRLWSTIYQMLQRK